MTNNSSKQHARDEWLAALTQAALTLRCGFPQLAYWVGLARDTIQALPLPGETNGDAELGRLRNIEANAVALDKAVAEFGVKPEYVSEAFQALSDALAKPCTCHPDDNPPRTCPQMYALSECRRASETPITTGAGKGADATMAATEPVRRPGSLPHEASARKFIGPGHLEETGYIPAGSAAEREGTHPGTFGEPRGGPWTIDEMLPDGNWRRYATAQAWDLNADAHRQCDELSKRFPKKIFAVRPMASPAETGAPRCTCGPSDVHMECPIHGAKSVPIDRQCVCFGMLGCQICGGSGQLPAETTTGAPPKGITWLTRGKPDFAHWRKDSNVPYDWCGCVSCNDARGALKATVGIEKQEPLT